MTTKGILLVSEALGMEPNNDADHPLQLTDVDVLAVLHIVALEMDDFSGIVDLHRGTEERLELSVAWLLFAFNVGELMEDDGA